MTFDHSAAEELCAHLNKKGLAFKLEDQGRWPGWIRLDFPHDQQLCILLVPGQAIAGLYNSAGQETRGWSRTASLSIDRTTLDHVVDWAIELAALAKAFVMKDYQELLHDLDRRLGEGVLGLL